ncbi:hypothetical protein HK413_04975 [Mucilaginibacter sp. S1162]|uniref:Outer membrane protein beta-barrel domain-containing protein n=1 Tax=Mucilaginibacter humi TaxID=2732510 RepID=A0ABX1W1B8_9SPHI|nr:hypothetical protein [Mucilaginibacter humi]NNU33659.1 hypothetical protein [Mucilaginibacter humi]
MGFDIDFQTNYKSGVSVAPKQSGVGLEGGVGAKYSYKSIMVFVSPYFQYHGIVKFNQQGSNFELIHTGVKFGMGYNF